MSSSAAASRFVVTRSSWPSWRTSSPSFASSMIRDSSGTRSRSRAWRSRSPSFRMSSSKCMGGMFGSAGKPAVRRGKAMEFGILGPLRVAGPGGEIPVAGAKRRALLAVLLLEHRDGVVSADRLIDELWGDRPARHRRQGAAGARLPAAAGARRRPADRDAADRLRGRAGARARSTSSASSATSTTRAACAPPATCAGAAAALRAGLDAVPRAAAGRRRAARPRLAARARGSRASGWPRSRTGWSSTSPSASHAAAIPELEALVAEHPTASGCTRT